MNKELAIRRRISNIYNKRAEDFPSLRAYNDYLEDVEDMTLNLIEGVGVQAIEEKIKVYQEENADQILAANARKAEERTTALRKQNVQGSASLVAPSAEQVQSIGQPTGMYAPAVAAGTVFMQPKPTGPVSQALHDREGTFEDEEAKKLREERGARAGGWSPELVRRRAFEEAFSSLWVN